MVAVCMHKRERWLIQNVQNHHVMEKQDKIYVMGIENIITFMSLAVYEDIPKLERRHDLLGQSCRS